MAKLGQSICTRYTLEDFSQGFGSNLHPVNHSGFHLQYLYTTQPKPGRPNTYVRVVIHGKGTVFLSSVWWDRSCLLRASIGRLEYAGFMYDIVEIDSSTWEVREIGLKRKEKFPVYNNGEIRKLSFQSGENHSSEKL